MADIETSVVISAQIDGLRSGMEAASNSVQAATDAMRAQLAGLGDIAQQAQSQLTAATGQIGTGIGSLQSKASNLAGSMGAGRMPSSGLGDASVFAQTSPALGNKNDVTGDEKQWEEKLLSYQKFQSDKEKLDLQAAQTSQRTWQSLMQPIQRAFDTSITGMILGTTTLQKAVANIAQSIIAEFVNLGVKVVTNWIASELAMTTATEAGAAARTAAEGAGMAAGLAVKAVNAVKSIMTDSAQAFSGIFAFLAPMMGPAAAGPAAAGEASVMAAASGIASAAGGWVVPSDQLAMVHQNEMILPANLSQGLQNMISANGGAGAGASPVVVNVSAIDSQDVKRFFQSNGSLLVNALNKAMRNGSNAADGVMVLIFPALPGLAWSVTKTPTFQTRVQRAVSGRELRALDYPYPLWQFALVYNFLRDNPAAGYDELRTLLGFFMLCQGAFGTFLFQDPSDCQVAGQQIGTGDASTTVFQLQRAMGATLPGGGFLEPIVAPNVVRAIYLNGITQDPSSYSVDPTTGLVTFGTAPSSGLIIAADFTYYFRCRFIDDKYDFENFMYRLWQIKKLTFISVRS